MDSPPPQGWCNDKLKVAGRIYFAMARYDRCCTLFPGTEETLTFKFLGNQMAIRRASLDLDVKTVVALGTMSSTAPLVQVSCTTAW